MKSLLCFGDSNTWGFTPGSGRRFDEMTRWPTLLANKLQLRLTENGKPGRTTCLAQTEMGFSAGHEELILELSKQPFDEVVLALGINDLMLEFKQTPADIRANMAQLIAQIKEHQPQARCWLVAPAPLGGLSPIWEGFFFGRQQDSIQLVNELKALAQELACEFVDTGALTKIGLDGLHLCANGHQALADHLSARL